MDVMSDKVSRTLVTALRGLALRQATIAGNIANVDTPGFKASVVTFEDQLQQALQPRSGFRIARSDGRGASLDDDRIDQVVPMVHQVPSSLRNDGNNVDIDREMVSLADTALRYQGIVRLLSDRLALLRTIANGGVR